MKEIIKFLSNIKSLLDSIYSDDEEISR